MYPLPSVEPTPPDDELAEAGEPEASEEEHAGDPERRRGPSLGTILLLGGVACWAAVAILRLDVIQAPATTMIVAEDDGEDTGAPAAEPQVAEPLPAPIQEPVEEQADEPSPDSWIDHEWAKNLETPDVVSYTVRHGGTLERVANLFKIYHHEILELNPGMSLDQKLSPGTHVVVYRKDPDVVSESVGYPGVGSIHGAVPMPEGPGRKLTATPWKAWATASTVAALDRALRAWAERMPDADPILVGNLSSPTGGKLEPHASHQSGRDVDLGYPQKRRKEEELGWRKITKDNVAPEETWTLLKILVETGAVEVVIMDRSIQKMLYDYAMKHGTVSKRDLRSWLEYPRDAGSGGALVVHAPRHDDHLHVRFACPREQTSCKTRGNGPRG